MSLPLMENLSAVAARVRRAPHVLLATNYDGTLTPLTSTPSQAVLSPRVRELLRSFAGRLKFSTTIVSGSRIGDDESDEDAFRFFSDSISIKVGVDSMATRARFHVEGTSEVELFLQWLDRISPGSSCSPGRS
jgi:trehalose-6-phosphatase